MHGSTLQMHRLPPASESTDSERVRGGRGYCKRGSYRTTRPSWPPVFGELRDGAMKGAHDAQPTFSTVLVRSLLDRPADLRGHPIVLAVTRRRTGTEPDGVHLLCCGWSGLQSLPPQRDVLLQQPARPWRHLGVL